MPTVEADALESFARTALVEAGTHPDTAGAVASSLVDADLAGHTSHGVVRVPWYVEGVATGDVDPDAEPSVESAGPFAQIAGGAAFGQLVGRRAVETLVETTRDRGIAAVGIRDSGHLGRIGEWAERVAGEGLLFVSWVNLQGGAQRIAPHGSADRRLGTNPLTFAVPAFGALPFDPVYDGATSQVAHGKVIERDGSGECLPEAWTVTDSGAPVERATDFEAGEGALLPFGGRETGYKGFGLATMAELFAAVVGGGPVATDPDQAWRGNGAAFLAVDPAAFTTPEGVAGKVEGLAEHVRSADPIDGEGGDAPGDDRILLPGEKEHETRQRRLEEGIPVTGTVAGDLRDLAAEQGTESSLPEPLR
jgi:uncharacterized oxidoreductase